MSMQKKIHTASELMDGFAARTGLDADGAQDRYLWTDAFAVCNFLGLSAVTGEARYRELALRLVDRVHHTLGRHRPDDTRKGWISGLDEATGEKHPTQGGLRIGKPLPERAPNEPVDSQLEWDRDGQYFHYLTQWMHALDRVSLATVQAEPNRWARELADTAIGGFSYVPPGGGRRMFWKMSIDLSRPLVPSMGQHDALDGYVVLLEIEATAAGLSQPASLPRLDGRLAELTEMLRGQRLVTTDPLGLGGLLIDAWRLQQTAGRGGAAHNALIDEVLSAARTGLSAYARQDELTLPAAHRLAFRELGLAIGLHAVARMAEDGRGTPQGASGSARLRAEVDALARFVELARAIESFWLEPAHQRAASWTEHRNINDVMLATSLVPTGFLGDAH